MWHFESRSKTSEQISCVVLIRFSFQWSLLNIKNKMLTVTNNSSEPYLLLWDGPLLSHFPSHFPACRRHQLLHPSSGSVFGEPDPDRDSSCSLVRWLLQYDLTQHPSGLDPLGLGCSWGRTHAHNGEAHISSS